MLKGINNFTFVNKILPKRQFKKRQRGFSMHPKRQPYTTKQIISSDTVPTILYKFTL